MPRSLLQTACLVALVVQSLFGLSACQCQDKKENVASKTEQVMPLEVVGVPSHIQVEVYPVEGTTDELPVALVFSETSASCSSVQEALKNKSHVLCYVPKAKQEQDAIAEKAMLEGLAFFKEKYAKYLMGRPAVLVVDPPYSELGLRMMLRDPGVFAYGYVPGVPRARITSTLLFTLYSQGARSLILTGPSDDDLELLIASAERYGLTVSLVPAGAPGLSAALELFKAKDERLH